MALSLAKSIRILCGQKCWERNTLPNNLECPAADCWCATVLHLHSALQLNEDQFIWFALAAVKTALNPVDNLHSPTVLKNGQKCPNQISAPAG